MKRFYQLIGIAILSFSLASRGYATVYLDDTWADGTRNNQALPSNSAWFASTGASLTAAPNSMSLAVGSGAIAALTYFTKNDTSPVHLDVGDTLVTTINLSFSGVAPLNSSAGFRLGIFDFADSTLSPKRVTTDGLGGNNTQGNGVQGFWLFKKMGVTFNDSNPMDIRKRTNLSSSALLGTSGDHTSLTNGPGNVSAFPGFADGTNYVLQFTFQRTATNALAITISWLNVGNGASLTTSTTDTEATNFNFDGIALRPSGNGSAASTIIFSEAKVELIPGATPPSIDSDPVDQSVFVDQDATFNVQASGTAPLSYQWYYNTTSAIANATSSSLTVTNAQLSDAGGYSVLVSNDYGSVTSAVAQLTVNTPVAPSITTQPQDQINILPGASATFTVLADGSDPLSYQWYYNNSTLLTGATDSTLTIANVQVANAGTYSVVVNNVAGSATSSNAVLTVDTSPVAPSFVTQPASQIVLVGGTANFSATAAGTTPINYQWKKDGVSIPGATSTTLTVTNVQNADSGSYAVTASNSVGTATSSNAVLTVTTAAPIVNSAYNLVGFGQATTGGGVIPTNNAAYKQVFTALDFANAILSANKTANSVKVIEIMNDLDLGWNEVGAAVQTLASTPFRAHNPPQLHPRLLVTGVSLIDIKCKSPLTIFSANGATIRHACFNIKSTANIIVRNLKFDEMWEWDEATKGNYDKNDWDFIDLGNGGTVNNIWIDHCTFTKSYDGIVDVKQGSFGITFSWNKYTGDDGATNPNSFVWQQINKLESNKTAYAMYNNIRTSGLSTTDIVAIIQGHDKTHLVGANSLKAENATHTLTFHHQWFINPWDRCVPRLRAGSVHDYNIYVDDTLALAARRLRDQHTSISSSYSFRPPLNGSISTEGGAILVEKSVYIDCNTPLRNNQTDPANPAYTGKIKALDTIYQYDSTFVRGNSTDPGNPLGPFQAPIIAFSWNLPGGVLPYSYTMDDPAQLQAIVTSPTGGAGAGVLTWNKTNWMMTAYAPSAPIISADPQSQTVALSNSVTFTVLAYGSAPMSYQWYFNTSSPVAGATNSSFSIASVQAGNVGTYSVIVSNSAGTATSASATLSLPSTATPFQNWQTLFFGCTNCPQADAMADPDGDGMSNQAEFLAGSDPTNSVSALRIISALPQNNDVVITWQTAGGRTNAVQATMGDGNGGYSTNFTDISGLVVLPGSGELTTNYLDAGGATSVPSRFYRVRLVP
jgi:pectate lyase